MHKLSNNFGTWAGFSSLTCLATINIVLALVPSVYQMSPDSKSFWMLHLEVLAPLKFPVYLIGVDPTETASWIFFWLGITISACLIAFTRLAWFAGFFCGGCAIYSIICLYAALAHSGTWNIWSAQPLNFTILLLFLISLAAVYGFATITSSYLDAMRKSRSRKLLSRLNRL